RQSRGRQMIGMIVRISGGVEIGDIDLRERRGAALEADDVLHRVDEIFPALIAGRTVDRVHCAYIATGQPLERLEAGARKTRAGAAVRQPQKITDGVAVAHPKYGVAIEADRALRILDRGLVCVNHEANGLKGAIFPRQVKWVLAAVRTGAEASIAGGDMNEDGLARSAHHVIEGIRVHEQLPI